MIFQCLNYFVSQKYIICFVARGSQYSYTASPCRLASDAFLTFSVDPIYNLIWGASVILFPSLAFDVLGIPAPADLSIWQGMGMVIGVYGVGYWLASYDPIRHWPIVAVGFLGKIFGPLGYVFNLLQDKISPSFGWMLIPNDLIWWIPFGLILWKVHQHKWPLK